MKKTKCGYIALLGRPNTGKSTLLNRIIGYHLSIITAKPQTTRHTVLGIKVVGNTQFCYVDTPGIHERQDKVLNKVLNRAAISVVRDVDVIFHMVQVNQWTDEDQRVLDHIHSGPDNIDVICVVNKIDTLQQKQDSLAFMKKIGDMNIYKDIVPIAARKSLNIDYLEKLAEKYLPDAPFAYSEDEWTDKSERFIASEYIREQLTSQLDKELPYSISVEIERFEAEKNVTHIAANIYVEKESQKRIVIGKGGLKLKIVGTRARCNLEKMLGRRVNLKLWVKIREKWTDDLKAINQLGYNDH